MKKIKEISGWLIVLVVVLASCRTERQTQRIVSKTLANNDAFNTIGMYWQGLHPCINDTVTKTLFLPGQPPPPPDTVWKDKVAYITKPYPVHDTINTKSVVTDTRAVQQAKDSATKYKALYEAGQAQLNGMNDQHQKEMAQLKADQEKALKAEHKRGNSWMWKFWGLSITAGLWITKGLWLKLLKFV